MLISDVVFFAVFFGFRSDFCCPASKKDRKRGLLLLLPSFLGVTANAVISYHYLTPVLGSGRHTLLNSFKESLDILFGSGSSIPVSHGAHMLELMMFWFSWGCIPGCPAVCGPPVAGTFLPPGIRPAACTHLLNLYSQNCCSYLTLEEDKQLYFGQNVDGVILTAWQVIPSSSTAIRSAQMQTFLLCFLNLKISASEAPTRSFS